jgi:hypothetical protein
MFDPALPRSVLCFLRLNLLTFPARFVSYSGRFVANPIIQLKVQAINYFCLKSASK